MIQSMDCSCHFVITSVLADTDFVMGEFKEIPEPDLLFASEDEKTFSSDSDLPSLPVPDLQHTLDRYLDSGDNVFTYKMYKEYVILKL
jgi:hypothetical protein